MATGQLLILGKAVHARRDGAAERWELRAAAVLMALMAVGALYGGIGLLLAPDGSLIQLPPQYLALTPFSSYAIPGFFLAVTVGGSHLSAAGLALWGHRWADLATVVAGGIVLVWIVVQLVLIGYVFLLQPIVFGWGALIFALGLWVARTRLS